MQGGKDQVSGFCGGQGQLDRIQVPHFAHEDDVRIFAEGRPQRIGKGQSMHAQLPLIDQALFRLVDELDRIFDREDMSFERIVQIVDHCSQRGGFSGAGRAGHQDQAFFPVAELPKDRRHAELFQRKNLGRNGPKDGAQPTALDEHIDAEPGDVAQDQRKSHIRAFPRSSSAERRSSCRR